MMRWSPTKHINALKKVGDGKTKSRDKKYVCKMYAWMFDGMNMVFNSLLM